MSRSRKDLTNQRFGNIVALYPTGALDAHNNVIWHCRCDCGNEIDRAAAMIPRLKSCGCKRLVPKDDIIGRKFGRLTVQEIIQSDDSYIKYKCICECGNEKVVERSNLLYDNVRSCGCLRVENGKRLGVETDHNLKKDIKGQRFGRLTALYDTGKCDSRRNTIWHVRCDCGTEIDVPMTYLTQGMKKSCGCLRRERIGQLNRERGKKKET